MTFGSRHRSVRGEVGLWRRDGVFHLDCTSIYWSWVCRYVSELGAMGTFEGVRPAERIGLISTFGGVTDCAVMQS